MDHGIVNNSPVATRAFPHIHSRRRDPWADPQLPPLSSLSASESQYAPELLATLKQPKPEPTFSILLSTLLPSAPFPTCLRPRPILPRSHTQLLTKGLLRSFLNVRASSPTRLTLTATVSLWLCSVQLHAPSRHRRSLGFGILQHLDNCARLRF